MCIFLVVMLNFWAPARFVMVTGNRCRLNCGWVNCRWRCSGCSNHNGLDAKYVARLLGQWFVKNPFDRSSTGRVRGWNGRSSGCADINRFQLIEYKALFVCYVAANGWRRRRRRRSGEHFLCNFWYAIMKNCNSTMKMMVILWFVMCLVGRRERYGWCGYGGTGC